jgi:glycosyltransferase involved in cell wall biosynthesis
VRERARAGTQGRRPRVALVAHGIHDHGGMERAFAELVRRIHARYEVVVLSADLGDDLRDLVEWRRIPVPARPAPLRFALFYVIAAVRLLATRADVVHTLGAIVPNAADFASVHFCTAGYVASVGRLAPPNAPVLRRANTALARLLFLAAERWTYRRDRVARLGAVSRGVARELARSFPGVPTVLTPNGVDRARFRPDPATRREVRRELAIADDDVVALFVGGDWHGKGLALAIRAVARTRLRLLVVGRGDERRFRALARSHGVEQRVTFLGPRDDPERYYAASDVFLLPSWYETFSLAAFEAAASGLPIVAAPVSGVEELVGDGDAGMLVERDAGAIAVALASLAASAESRRRLGDAARARSAVYTWDRSADAVLAVYRSVLAREAVTA